jgi:hypothetical protein
MGEWESGRVGRGHSVHFVHVVYFVHVVHKRSPF